MKRLILLAPICYLPLQLKLPNLPMFPIVNILALLMLGLLITSSNKDFRSPKFEVPLYGFLMIWFFSFVWACMVTDGMPRIKILQDFKRLYLLVLCYFTYARCITTKKDLNFCFIAFLCILVFAAHNTMRNGVLAGANFALHKRSGGPFGMGWKASDIAGAYIATFAPFVLSYFFFTLKKIPKLVSAISMGICGLGLMATYSRGSMMALLFSCLALVFVGGRQLAKGSKANFFVIMVGLIIGIVMWKAWVPKAIIHRIEGTVVNQDEIYSAQDFSIGGDGVASSLDHSSVLRMHAWRQGLDFFFQNPLTGIGFRQVQHQLGHDPHNSFVLIGAEMGFAGIMMFIWMIFAITRESFKLFDTEHRIIGIGFVGAMVGFVVVNMFYSNFFRDNVVGSFWTMLGIMAAALNLQSTNGGEEGTNVERTREKIPYSEYRKRYLQSIALIVGLSVMLLTSPFRKIGITMDSQITDQSKVTIEQKL